MTRRAILRVVGDARRADGERAAARRPVAKKPGPIEGPDIFGAGNQAVSELLTSRKSGPMGPPTVQGDWLDMSDDVKDGPDATSKTSGFDKSSGFDDKSGGFDKSSGFDDKTSGFR